MRFWMAVDVRRARCRPSAVHLSLSAFSTSSFFAAAAVASDARGAEHRRRAADHRGIILLVERRLERAELGLHIS